MAYEVKIIDSSKELTARDRIKFKDVSSTQSLDRVVGTDDTLVIKPVNYVVLAVHNDKSDNKDHTKYIIEDENGVLYSTGSESFFESFMNIHTEMNGEDYNLVVYKRESKNYSGKHFLSCTIE